MPHIPFSHACTTLSPIYLSLIPTSFFAPTLGKVLTVRTGTPSQQLPDGHRPPSYPLAKDAIRRCHASVVQLMDLLDSPGDTRWTQSSGRALKIESISPVGYPVVSRASVNLSTSVCCSEVVDFLLDIDQRSRYDSQFQKGSVMGFCYPQEEEFTLSLRKTGAQRDDNEIVLNLVGGVRMLYHSFKGHMGHKRRDFVIACAHYQINPEHHLIAFQSLDFPTEMSSIGFRSFAPTHAFKPQTADEKKRTDEALQRLLTDFQDERAVRAQVLVRRQSAMDRMMIRITFVSQCDLQTGSISPALADSVKLEQFQVLAKIKKILEGSAKA